MVYNRFNCGNGRNMLNPNYNFIGVDNCVEFIKII